MSYSKRNLFAVISAQLACVIALGVQAATPNAVSTAPTEELTEVTVTGSRVIANGNDSPSPVTVVAVDDMLAVHPGTVADGLNDLPVFSGSRGQTTNAGGGTAGQVTAANPSASVLNMRNMGTLRTLVLFDGHRLPPTSPDGAVDINMIPQLLLQRVDIVTGGASAVYGSDAVTGVVNFITDSKFEGFKANLQGGVSSSSDDRTADSGVAWGKSLFNGRGHFEISAQGRSDPEVLRRSERAWGRNVWTAQGVGTTPANAYLLTRDTRISTASFGGLIVNNASGPAGVLVGQQFASNGILSAFNHGALTGTAGFESGGDGSYNNSSFKAALKMAQLFTRMDYDFSDNTHGYVALSGSYNYNKSISNPYTINNLVLSSQNAFLSASYRNQLTTAAQPTFRLSKTFNDFPSQTAETFERQYFANAVLQGKFGEGYRWDLSLIHGQAKQNTRQNYNLLNQNLYEALDAVVNPANNQVVCNVTLTNPTVAPGCVPLNVFGPSAATPDALNFLLHRTQFWATTTMDDLATSVTGAPFSTWAGPVNTALSAEWRRLRYDLVPDGQPADPVNCTGIRFNGCTAATLAYAAGASAARSEVTQQVSEAAFEMDLPLLADMRFAKNVDLNTAVRYTHYSTNGSANTWKAGLDWHFSDALTMRSTRSRDIRAPTLQDLLAPTVITQAGVQDLLTGLSPQVPQQSGGNPNLVSEVGYTTTLGFVYKPTEKLSLALDGFDISVNNAITNQQGTNPTLQQICYTSRGTSNYCTLQERPIDFINTTPANAVTKWYNRVINIATQRSWGTDFELNYSTRTFDRPLLLRGLVTYQPHILYEAPGTTTIDLGGVAFSSNALQASPVWRATVTARLGVTDRFIIDAMERWRSSLAWTGDPNQFVASPDISSVSYTNLNLTYRMKGATGQADLFFNVENLFDKQPPPGAFLGANGNPGGFGGYVYGDDVVGRYYTVGIRYRR
jgi:outer membrane receptor protein involved in Fe transport